MNFVESLFERSLGSDGDIIIGVKEASTFGKLREKVEQLFKWIAWQYGPGKELLVLSGNRMFFAPACLAAMDSGKVPLLVEARASWEGLAKPMLAGRPDAAFTQSCLASVVAPGLPVLIEDDVQAVVANRCRERPRSYKLHRSHTIVPDLQINTSKKNDKVCIREMLSRGEIAAR